MSNRTGQILRSDHEQTVVRVNAGNLSGLTLGELRAFITSCAGLDDACPVYVADTRSATDQADYYYFRRLIVQEKRGENIEVIDLSSSGNEAGTEL